MAIDERLIFYEGKHVRLKALSSQDIIDSDWVRWFNDEVLSQYNRHHYFPNTFEQEQKFLESCTQPSKLVVGIVDRLNETKICGVVSLQNIDFIHRHAEIACMLDKKITIANPFIFLESWSLILRHGFEQLGLYKIYAGTFHPHVVGNATKMFNFEIEGVMKKQIFKNNAYHDVTMYAVFRDTIKYPEF
ncbi:MAG: GNAT family N-acetyltransferase [Coxiellaceae bacterium]|jgi:RimJ/RimL family protein N-acetyltransferase|nr:GNAT family N-acetyltransferase [Coxiellaceae bacterium]